jgi:hypothetical protein
MTVAGRGAAAAVLAAGVLFATAGPAPADVSLQAQTAATAVHVSVTQQPASSIITASLFDDAVAYAAGDFDSGGSSEALAAPAFPGRLVVQGPQLLCSELFSCPATPPSYPLLADASYPRRQHDTATVSGQPTGSGPFVVTPLSATASAAADGNAGTTAGGTTSLLAGTPGAVTVGASSASTTLRAAGRGLRLEVQSTVSDVSIAGLVHIATVAARDDISVAPGSRAVDKPTITVAGVTAAGQAATIDDRGVHVAGADGPSVSRQLTQAGVSIRLVGTHHADTRSGARSDATALEVDVAVPVNGVPYVPNPLPTLPPPFDQVPQLPGVNANGTYLARVTLGAVGAAAGFGVEPTLDLGGSGVVPSPEVAGGGSAGGPGGATAPGSLGSQLGAGGGVPPATAPQLAAGQAGGLRGFLDGFGRGQVETLYAVLALGAVLMFVGWRGATVLRHGPARTRRRR